MMSNVPLQQLRDDLVTIRHAMGIDLPFGRSDVVANLWLTACGLFTALWAGLARWEYRWIVFIPISVAVLIWFWCAFHAYRNRCLRPWNWREQRMALLYGPPLMLCVMAYMRWERHLGMPRQMVGAAAIFSIGIATLFISLVDRRRRYLFSGGIAFIAFGLTIPLLRPAGVIMAAGMALAASGLGAAIIQARQLRSEPASQ